MLTEEEIAEFDLARCDQELFKLEQQWDFDQTLNKNHPAWPILDELTTVIILLQERRDQFAAAAKIVQANNLPQGLYTASGELRKRAGPKKKKFRIGDRIYENIDEAHRITGINLNTLKAYCTRKPTIYGYIQPNKD